MCSSPSATGACRWSALVLAMLAHVIFELALNGGKGFFQGQTEITVVSMIGDQFLVGHFKSYTNVEGATFTMMANHAAQGDFAGRDPVVITVQGRHFFPHFAVDCRGQIKITRGNLQPFHETSPLRL